MLAGKAKLAVIPEWSSPTLPTSERQAAEGKELARCLFDRAQSQGWSEGIRSRLLGRPHSLLKLAAPSGSAHDAGLQTVDFRQIRGSENRCSDFDAQFHPLRLGTRDRWTSIAAARLMGAILPPVELIQVGDIYYVRDGHHRISVARALGEEYIEAHVTAWTP